MPQPQFIPSPLKIIERRRCQNCGTTMMLTAIEPIGLVTDRRTFACDQCGHEEELLVNSFH
jgi:DNA-directed RNA polymerase subunit M/transcription elongation factor TFIIS